MKRKLFKHAAPLLGTTVISQPSGTTLRVAAGVVAMSVVWILAIRFAGGLSHLNPGVLLIPIVLAGFYFGPLAGVGTAAAVGLAVGPWMPAGPGISQPTADWAIRLLSYAAVGGILGALSLRQHNRARKTIQQQRNIIRSTPEIIERERLKALQDMSRGVVHDINNTLAPILGFSEMLIDPQFSKETATVKRYAEAINTAATNASAVVTRMREFYRTDGASAALAPVNLALVVEQSLSMTEARWRSQARNDGAEIAIDVDCPSDHTILGNDAELRGVLTNLIFNAVDAMPHGGTLSFTGTQTGTHIALTVTDTGNGMRPETLRQCTEAYFTTKENGTGLGTSLAKAVMRYHGGRMEIASEEGKGTRVTLLFPIAEPSKLNFCDTEETVSRVPALRILVAEDDDLVREMLEEVLVADGHQVSSTLDGEVAVTSFRENPDRFDLVICDSAMPRLNGRAVAAGIRKIRPDMPFIMLSGFDTVNASATFENRPSTIVLTKPITLNDLRKALGEASGRSSHQ